MGGLPVSDSEEARETNERPWWLPPPLGVDLYLVLLGIMAVYYAIVVVIGGKIHDETEAQMVALAIPILPWLLFLAVSRARKITSFGKKSASGKAPPAVLLGVAGIGLAAAVAVSWGGAPGASASVHWAAVCPASGIWLPSSGACGAWS